MRIIWKLLRYDINWFRGVSNLDQFCDNVVYDWSLWWNRILVFIWMFLSWYLRLLASLYLEIYRIWESDWDYDGKRVLTQIQILLLCLTQMQNLTQNWSMLRPKLGVSVRLRLRLRLTEWKFEGMILERKNDAWVKKHR